MIHCKSLSKTLDSYLSEHLGLSPGYANLLRIAVSHFERWHGRPARLSEVSRDRLLQFMRDQLAWGLSPATVNGKRRALLTLLHSAGMSFAVPRVPEPIGMPEAWTVAQCEAIFAACPSNWWLSLAVTIYWTGERIKAVLSVRTDDCDLAAGTMVVRARSHKSRRDRLLWIPEQAADLIAKNYDPAQRLLWPWPHCRRYLFRSFRKIVESAGVPCPRTGRNLFHRLRRTSGSLVEAYGGDGARHLGNSRAVFERHYRDMRLAGGAQISHLPTPRLPNT